MGYELRLTGSPQGDHTTRLCTNLGYANLCKWFASLPPDKYPAVKSFAASDSYPGTDALVLQIDQALKDNPPEDRAVFDLANRLADLLGNGHADETATALP